MAKQTLAKLNDSLSNILILYHTCRILFFIVSFITFFVGFVSFGFIFAIALGGLTLLFVVFASRKMADKMGARLVALSVFVMLFGIVPFLFSCSLAGALLFMAERNSGLMKENDTLRLLFQYTFGLITNLHPDGSFQLLDDSHANIDSKQLSVLEVWLPILLVVVNIVILANLVNKAVEFLLHKFFPREDDLMQQDIDISSPINKRKLDFIRAEFEVYALAGRISKNDLVSLLREAARNSPILQNQIKDAKDIDIILISHCEYMNSLKFDNCGSNNSFNLQKYNHLRFSNKNDLLVNAKSNYSVHELLDPQESNNNAIIRASNLQNHGDGDDDNDVDVDDVESQSQLQHRQKLTGSESYLIFSEYSQANNSVNNDNVSNINRTSQQSITTTSSTTTTTSLDSDVDSQTKTKSSSISWEEFLSLGIHNKLIRTILQTQFHTNDFNSNESLVTSFHFSNSIDYNHDENNNKRHWRISEYISHFFEGRLIREFQQSLAFGMLMNSKYLRASVVIAMATAVIHSIIIPLTRMVENRENTNFYGDPNDDKTRNFVMIYISASVFLMQPLLFYMRLVGLYAVFEKTEMTYITQSLYSSTFISQRHVRKWMMRRQKALVDLEIRRKFPMYVFTFIIFCVVALELYVVVRWIFAFSTDEVTFQILVDAIILIGFSFFILINAAESYEIQSTWWTFIQQRRLVLSQASTAVLNKPENKEALDFLQNENGMNLLLAVEDILRHSPSAMTLSIGNIQLTPNLKNSLLGFLFTILIGRISAFLFS